MCMSRETWRRWTFLLERHLIHNGIISPPAPREPPSNTLMYLLDILSKLVEEKRRSDDSIPDFIPNPNPKRKRTMKKTAKVNPNNINDVPTYESEMTSSPAPVSKSSNPKSVTLTIAVDNEKLDSTASAFQIQKTSKYKLMSSQSNIRGGSTMFSSHASLTPGKQSSILYWFKMKESQLPSGVFERLGIESHFDQWQYEFFVNGYRSCVIALAFVFNLHTFVDMLTYCHKDALVTSATFCGEIGIQIRNARLAYYTMSGAIMVSLTYISFGKHLERKRFCLTMCGYLFTLGSIILAVIMDEIENDKSSTVIHAYMLAAIITYRAMFPMKTKHFVILTTCELLTLAAALARDPSLDMIKIVMCIVFISGFWVDHIATFDFELRKFYILQCLINLADAKHTDGNVVCKEVEE
ncbi:hypothetical protein HDU76_001165 [Blyttiomyces sp. JEL0837]|nr:hypothetical protein HDU76_001165 [Blyttiomyces sp. JEL0837]